MVKSVSFCVCYFTSVVVALVLVAVLVQHVHSDEGDEGHTRGRRECHLDSDCNTWGNVLKGEDTCCYGECRDEDDCITV